MQEIKNHISLMWIGSILHKSMLTGNPVERICSIKLLCNMASNY